MNLILDVTYLNVTDVKTKGIHVHNAIAHLGVTVLGKTTSPTCVKKPKPPKLFVLYVEKITH